MPHLKLEYSANIKETLKADELFSKCHQILVDTIGADIATCQSRATRCDLFHVGTGDSREAFIYLEVLLFEGRSPLKLHKMGTELKKALEEYFALSLKELNLQIAVHTTEFTPPHYCK